MIVEFRQMHEGWVFRGEQYSKREELRLSQLIALFRLVCVDGDLRQFLSYVTVDVGTLI